MSVIAATVAGIRLEHDIGDLRALGWRWWRRSMFDLGYQDERCVCLGHIDLRPIDIAGQWVLIAYERDALLDLCSPFSLFPITDDASALAGAAKFAARVVAEHSKEPLLL